MGGHGWFKVRIRLSSPLKDSLLDEHSRKTLGIEVERYHLSETLRLSAVSILMANPQGQITCANPAFRHFCGHDNTELSELSSTYLCPACPASQAQQQTLIEQLHTHGYWSGELAQLTREGTPMPVPRTGKGERP